MKKSLEKKLLEKKRVIRMMKELLEKKYNIKLERISDGWHVVESEGLPWRHGRSIGSTLSQASKWLYIHWVEAA